MATTKLTIRLPGEQLEQIRSFISAGQAASVSDFVRHAVEIALYDAAASRDMLQDALAERGGPLTKSERAWADAILSPAVQKNYRGR
jgi:Arc/MetJ-type ribon-helix-helix transcriptional regulator